MIKNIAAIVILLVLTACSGNETFQSSKPTVTHALADVSGDWNGTITSNLSGTHGFTTSLVQRDAVVGGDYMIGIGAELFTNGSMGFTNYNNELKGSFISYNSDYSCKRTFYTAGSMTSTTASPLGRINLKYNADAACGYPVESGTISLSLVNLPTPKTPKGISWFYNYTTNQAAYIINTVPGATSYSYFRTYSSNVAITNNHYRHSIVGSFDLNQSQKVTPDQSKILYVKWKADNASGTSKFSKELIFNPVTDRKLNYWDILGLAPTKRAAHSAVWTGSKMIVWGGFDETGTSLKSGWSYDPLTDHWQAISSINAPDARSYHSAIWTGSEMIIWGGQAVYNQFPTGGGAYNPVTDSWRPLSAANAPQPAVGARAVWTGTEMIVWGGVIDQSTLNSTPTGFGGRYNPLTDSWKTMSTVNAPSPRYGHSMVWSGNNIIIWGGATGNLGTSSTGSGYKYNPSTNSWAAISSTNAPEARYNHIAVWTGSEMIIFGGRTTRPGIKFKILKTCFRYNPITDLWNEIPTDDIPYGFAHGANFFITAPNYLWTGDELLVYGGIDSIKNDASKYGLRLNPSTNTWDEIPVGPTADSFDKHSIVWTGTSMLLFGGYNDYYNFTDTKARNWTFKYTPYLLNSPPYQILVPPPLLY